MSHRKTMTLSKFLKGYLEEWNINQDTLAEDMDVSVNTLRDWIYKGKDANDTNLEKIKDYFHDDVRFERYLEDRDKKGDDPVNHPAHYNQGGIETLDIIKMCLTREEYKGYLKGNILKYRERSQFKGNAEQDYAKAKFYFDELEELE